MITIRHQFLGFKIGGWLDEYEFTSFAPETETIDVISKILGVEVCGRSYDGSYVFKRGKGIWTILGIGSEKRLLQEISVRFEGGGTVVIHYRVIGGIWLRGKPCGLEKEAQMIASLLAKEADLSAST